MSDADDIRRGGTLGGRKMRDILLGERPVITAGPGVAISSDPLHVQVRSIAPDPRRRVVFDALIVGNQAVSANKWDYSWTEQLMGEDGSWFAKTPGRSSSDPEYGLAKNRYEIPNGPTGVQGNGVDVGNLVGTFALQPIATGIVIPIELVTNADGSGVVPWIKEPNGVDGACPGLSPSQQNTNRYLLTQHPPP